MHFYNIFLGYVFKINTTLYKCTITCGKYNTNNKHFLILLKGLYTHTFVHIHMYNYIYTWYTELTGWYV